MFANCALAPLYLALGDVHLVEVVRRVVVEEDAFRVQDDGHRFGAMSPQTPLIVSDRGAQSSAPTQASQ
jgi:hypothetical protein